ncbi:MAG: redoxin domain-containing protein [Gammaproteobacteria bacterium]|nr:redoxin domain-containing protein [Gammaproteobacteria bacterium]MYF52526.1 redoxin domain-containing protein [Gammaproteobacteria bacterium]MYK43287.1 redoxin domain-containing protein [Gammaproteobacteria bacterium]
MNKLVNLIRFSFAVVTVCLCGSLLSAPYFITGEVIYLENQETIETAGDITVDETIDETAEETVDETEANTLDNSEEASTENSQELEVSEEAVFDPMSAQVVITYETTNEEGDTEEVELVAQEFTEGRFFFRESTTEPLDLTITVTKSEDEQITSSAVLEPGRNLRFAYVVGNDSYPYDRLVLVGQSLSKEQDSKATIVGDLSDTNVDLSRATAYVYGRTTDDEGEMVLVMSPTVLLHEDRFQIEVGTDKPMAVNVVIYSVEHDFSAVVDAVIEPGNTVTVNSTERNGRSLFYAEGGERHTKLISNWQKSDKYLDSTAKYQIAYEQWHASEELNEISEDTEVEHDSTEEAQIDETEKETQDEVVEVADIELAEGCEHVEAPKVADTATMYPWREAYDVMNDMKHAMLEHLALTSEDPINALLALDIGAFGYGRDQERALEVYDKVLASYEEETSVPKWIMKSYEDQKDRVEIVRNAKAIVVGQKAPTFTLADRDGNEYTLSVVLAQQDTVLVDFWASWCGPCIASFPHLKEMHKAFAAEGFEIVGISIDSEMDDWLEALDEHDLPWMNVGEILGDDTLSAGSVGHTYGIQAIPTTIWIDSEGCIIGKNLSYDSLEEALVDRYGEITETDES